MRRIITVAAFLLVIVTTFAQKPYRGAEVYSNDEVLYGKFVMRMKMIKGSGMLSTFFTYKGDSWQTGVFWEEIDIEVLGKNNAQIMSTSILQAAANTFAAWQNEHSESIEIQFVNNGFKNIQLYSITGELIESKKINGTSAFISTNGVETGIYLLRVDGDHYTDTQQILLK